MTTGQVPAGSNLLVEYDPASQWYNAALTIAAGWLKGRGTVDYNASVESPAQVRLKLNGLGVNVEEHEKEGRLELWDVYTVLLGRKSDEKFVGSLGGLKVSEASIAFAKEEMSLPIAPDMLRIADDLSYLDRFNDEKNWLEFVVSRVFPAAALRKITAIRGFMKGVHSEKAYSRLEGAADGIIDFKLEELGEEAKNLMRIRSMRNVGFDSRWHPLKINENFEVILEK